MTAKTNIIQYDEYYPFGLQTENSWTRENSSNNFLYNGGSELNANSGWYETFFRGYDATLGRFNQVDPLAGALASFSPYNYGLNNPVFFNDPAGDYVQPVKPPEHVGQTLFEIFGGGGSDGFANVVAAMYGESVIPEGGSSYVSASDFYANAINGHGGFWSNGEQLLYQYDLDAFNYYQVEEYHDAIDHGQGWYGLSDGILVGRYEWIDGIRLNPKRDATYGDLASYDPTLLEPSWVQFIRDHYYMEVKAQASYGPQGSVTVLNGVPIIGPYLQGVPGLYINLGSNVLWEYTADNRNGARPTATFGEKYTQGIEASYGGVAAGFQREITGAGAVDTFKVAFYGIFTFEGNSKRQGFIGIQWNARWALGLGFEGQAKSGFTFDF